MWIHTRKPIATVSSIHHVFRSPAIFFSVSPYSTCNQLNQKPLDETVCEVLNLIKTPNWEQNGILKSLVSHMNPYGASRVISSQSSNTDICVRFFNWVCKQSTYCYNIEQRIELLKLIVSYELYGVALKVIIVLIKECVGSRDEILKLIGALDGLRDTGFRLNYPCYSSLLMTLAKSDLGLLAYTTYKRMVADGFLAGNIDYRTIINAFCKNGLVEAAESFLCRVLKLGFDFDTHVCTSLLLGYCRNCNLKEALKVFDKMSQENGCAPNSVSYTVLIHGLCEMGRVEKAFAMKVQMAENGCLPSTRTYTVLIKSLCDQGLIDKALNLADEMAGKGCKPSIHTYTVLIDGLCKEGKIEEANGMFKKMVGDELFPSLITYNALINGYCKNGRIVSAFEILSLMEKKKCTPNVRTYNELMEGLCRVGKAHKAMFLLKKMVDNGMSPDIVSYNVLIDGFCRERNLKTAYMLFSSMKSFDLDPDCLSFTAIIDGLCKQEKPELASAFLCLMVKKGVNPDEVTFTSLIDGFCKVGKVRDGLMLLGTLVKTTRLKTPHSLNLFLDVLSRGCDLNKEYAMIGKIIKFGLVLSVVSYTILIDGHIRSGDITGSLKVMQLMRLAGCTPNVYTYTVIINGLCNLGRIEEAEKILSSMSESGVHPNHVTYTVFVKAHVDVGRLDRALETVSTMVKSGCQLNQRIYTALLKGIFVSYKTFEVDESFVDSKDDENFLSDNVLGEISLEHIYRVMDMIEQCGGSASEICCFFVTGLCRKSRTTEAYNMIESTLNRGLFPENAVYCIVECYCKEKEFEECLELITLVLASGFVPSFESFSLVIQGLQKEGKIEQARGVVHELLNSCGIMDKNAVLPYIEFLLKGDEVSDCPEVTNVLEQVHYRDRPIF